MSWYYAEGGKQIGPVADGEWRRLVSSRQVKPDTLVWQEGMENWVPFSQAPGAAAAAASSSGEPVNPDTPAPVGQSATSCSECGKTFPPDELVAIEGRPVCASCKPIVVQKLKEGSLPAGLMDYGGFGIRAGAKIIDGIIIYVANMAIAFVVGMGMSAAPEGTQQGVLTGVLFALQMLISIGYSVWFLGKFGATPGKMACGLRVVRADGSAITYMRAFGRFFAEMLSAMIIYIGYIMAAFDDEKRTLHDRICDTRVIRSK